MASGIKKSKAPKKEKEVTLEQVLWNCRVALRGFGSFEKNRDSVIGLAFLKFAGDKFEKRRKEIIAEYGDIPVFLEKPAFYNSQNVYYLPEHCRWSFIVKNAGDNDIAVKLDTAMKDIEDANPPLKGTLPQNNYASLGADKNAIKSLIDEINKLDESRFHEEDLIGRVYEYFLQNFAASASKEDGEFYTPACCVKLISELIEPYDGIVYDPCCGSGGMFVLTVHGSECVTNRLRELNVGFPKGSLSEVPVGRFKGYDVIGRCVEYNTLTPFSNYDISGYRVTVVPSEHVNYEPSFVYGITKNNKTVFILSDTAMLTDKEIAYFADSGLKADAIIYDCTYGEDERNEGHMNIEDNCLLRDKFISLKVADNNTKHIISHLAHSLMKTHGELCEMGNKYSFIVAYDGMEIEI